MRIGILSDTHGDTTGTQAALCQFDAFEVDLIIHCGDVGGGLIPLFGSRPVHFVFGNTDNRSSLQEEIEQAGHNCHGRFGQLELADRRIAFLHGDDASRMRDELISGQWDFLFYGHSHEANNQQVGSTRVVNPGAIRRTHKPSVAIMDLASGQVDHIPI